MLFWPFKHSQQQSMNTFLIVGLGNIGIDYKNTRHNIGFAVLDALSTKFNVSFSTLRYGNLAEISHEGRKIILLKPSTLMNRSGQAVRYWAKQKKMNLQNILVITDDVHLDFGYLRLRKQGSDGGHNGLRDIQEKLGSTKYPRLRIGVGSNFSKGRQADYVLSTWNPDEQSKLPLIVDQAVKAVIHFATQGLEQTMNLYNGHSKVNEG
ncbi:MAG: aminoacyl-tRNA hydrolase [Flavobacteriales bacterium]|nr:aminoacyl-tRNA hydrolase [Flavobacteriales bacterium]